MSVDFGTDHSDALWRDRDGAVLDRAARHPLDDAVDFFEKYAAYPTVHHGRVLALWVAHTYTYDEFDTSPRLFLDSAVPACGKTRTLELIDATAADPLMAFNASPAALIRTIDRGGRTILMDEIDTLYNKTSGTEDVTAVINAGYKQGATVPRCTGQGSDIQVVELRAYAPMALAGLHASVPDAVRSRSIHFRMQKRKATEQVAPYRRRDAEPEAENIRTRLVHWLEPARPVLRDARPVLPDGVEDRAAEVWEPLLAIADLAGEEWPAVARGACHHFVFATHTHTPHPGIELLSDIREVMTGKERIPSADLVAALLAKPEVRWRNVRGGSLNQSALAQLLRPFDIYPKNLKYPENRVVRGYTSSDLRDVWERYLPN